MIEPYIEKGNKNYSQLDKSMYHFIAIVRTCFFSPLSRFDNENPRKNIAVKEKFSMTMIISNLSKQKRK